MLAATGMPEVRVSYEGGSLAAVFNWLENTDALTVLLHSVVFAHRAQRQVVALPSSAGSAPIAPYIPSST